MGRYEKTRGRMGPRLDAGLELGVARARPARAKCGQKDTARRSRPDVWPALMLLLELGVARVPPNEVGKIPEPARRSQPVLRRRLGFRFCVVICQSARGCGPGLMPARSGSVAGATGPVVCLRSSRRAGGLLSRRRSTSAFSRFRLAAVGRHSGPFQFLNSARGAWVDSSSGYTSLRARLTPSATMAGGGDHLFYGRSRRPAHTGQEATRAVDIC
jgi:hypothetical protein